MISPASLQKLREALGELERDLEQRSRELAELRQRVAPLREMVNYFGMRVAESPAAPSPPARTARNALVEILREAETPLHYRQLLELLRQRGVMVGGQDAAASVRSHLSHDERFVPVGNGLWDLTARARPKPADSATSAPPPVQAPYGGSAPARDVTDQPGLGEQPPAVQPDAGTG